MSWAGLGPKLGLGRHVRTGVIDRRGSKSEAIVPISKKTRGDRLFGIRKTRIWSRKSCLSSRPLAPKGWENSLQNSTWGSLCPINSPAF
jgi:hypothetical protein